MASELAEYEFSVFEDDYWKRNIGDIRYLDTWDYEDNYSHNDIDIARDEFIKMANEFLEGRASKYYMREVNENAMLCYRDTDEIVR